MLVMEIAVGMVVILLLLIAALFLLAAPFLFFSFLAAIAHDSSPIPVCASDALAWKATSLRGAR